MYRHAVPKDIRSAVGGRAIFLLRAIIVPRPAPECAGSCEVTSEENVYHGQGTLRRRRGNPAGLVLEGADGCGGRTGRESNRWQVRSRGWFGEGDCQQDGLSRAQ